MLKGTVLTLILIALICCLFPVLRFLYYALVGKLHARKAVPFTRYCDNPTTKVLVIGDSTALGTGVTDPKHSIPGRLCSEFPNLLVENYAKNGLRTFEVLTIMETLPVHFYDIIIIHVGGMDVMQFKNIHKTGERLKKILTRAQQIANKGVILVSVPNITLAPMLWFPVSFLYEQRIKKARDLFKTIALENHVAYVDLYHETTDPLIKEGIAHYAIDKIHPNNTGYGLWYERIRPIFATLLS